MNETPGQIATRRFSRAVFGNRHKLEVLAAIGTGDRLFYVQDVAARTGIPSSTVRPITKDLSDVLARELPHVGTATSARFYERLDHPFWQMAIDLLDEVNGHSTGSPADASAKSSA